MPIAAPVWRLGPQLQVDFLDTITFVTSLKMDNFQMSTILKLRDTRPANSMMPRGLLMARYWPEALEWKFKMARAWRSVGVG